MRKWLPLVTICLGAFILLVDVTIVNVALPSMASDLDAPFSALQWVVDGYALALAALLMVAGSLGDLFGHRRLFVAGLGVFAMASLGASLSPNAGVLIAARAVQGVGGAAAARQIDDVEAGGQFGAQIAGESDGKGNEDAGTGGHGQCRQVFSAGGFGR